MTRSDRANGYTETLTMTATPAVANGLPTGAEAISSLQTLSRTYYNYAGQAIEKDDYFNLSGVSYSTAPHIGTASGNSEQGTAGSSYYVTWQAYDNRGRLFNTITANGTVYETDYDGLGRPVAGYVGTVQVSANQYDNGGVGDGNLTQVTEFTNDGTYNRVTQYWYDWRDRQVISKQGAMPTLTQEVDGTNRPIIVTTYDNLNEVVETQQYVGDGVGITVTNGIPQAPAAGLLRAQTATLYDELGQAYQTLVFSVDPSSGAVSTSALVTNVYRDLDGDVVAQSNPGGLWTKTVHDGAGRAVAVYTTDGAGGNAFSVAQDDVLQETDTSYDGDGNAILVVTKQRFNNDGALGPLGNPTAEPYARVYYVASYFDAANRPIATLNVGTNGSSPWTRPSSAPAPADPENPSNTQLVTAQQYNPAGWLALTTDPGGIETGNYYDNLGRVIKTVQDYNDSSGISGQATEFGYDGDNNRVLVQADLPGGQVQQTAYIYGVTTSNGSGVNSNDLLYQIQYPDPTTGLASSNASQTVTYTVNAQGQNMSMTNRNGTKHVYRYDVLGRQTDDTVVIPGFSGNNPVDTTITALQTAYNSAGQAYLFSSLDANGNVVNQVQDVFNGLGQLVQEYQCQSGAVNTTSTPSVQYGYTQMVSGGSYVNNSRLTTITYPNQQQLNYNYYGIDDAISRVSAISDSGTANYAATVLETDSYLGLATLVVRGLNAGPANQTGPYAPAIVLSYLGSPGDGGDQYAGLDRFGRVIDQNWMDMVNNVSLSHVQSGYDPDSNRLYASNLVNSSFSELYTYDNYNQLTYFARGILTASTSGGPLNTIAAPSRSMTWSTNSLGDSSQLQITDTTNGNSTQGRGYNRQNQLTSLTTNNTTTGILYDNNGNVVLDQKGNRDIYDAWNRLVRVANNSTGATQAAYQFDALGRRIQETNYALTTTDVYFNSAGQAIEERQGGVMSAQYVWSPAGSNLLTERDVNTSIYPSSVPARVYVLQDPIGNVVAIVTGGPAVVERYVYDPFGAPTFLGSNWSLENTTAGFYSMLYLFQGGRFDANTGDYIFGKRDLNPALGRWMETDPLGFGGGDLNTYRFAGSNPTNYTDPSGEIVPLVIGLGVLAFELYGLYAANQALAQYDAVNQINALPADQYTPTLAGQQQQLMQSARWNGAVANVAMVTAGAYSIGFGLGLGFTALGAAYPGVATVAGQGLAFLGTTQLMGQVVATAQNWNQMDGAARFEAVGSLAGGMVGGTGGFMSGRGFAGWAWNGFQSLRRGLILNDDISTPTVYSVAFETRLARPQFGLSRPQHFEIANEALQAARSANPQLAKLVPAPAGWGRPPANWTWQHATIEQAGGRAGVLQLVPRSQHTPGSPFWSLFHPLVGGGGGYSQWAIPAGAPPN